MQRDDGIIIPQIRLRTGQLEEEEEEKENSYKRIGEARGKWVQKIGERKVGQEQERESKRFSFEFLSFESFSCTLGTLYFSYMKA